MSRLQGLSLSPTSQQPGATHVHIASDHPEDTAAASKNMMELHELWDEWRSFSERKLKGDQVQRLPPVLALWRWQVLCHLHNLDSGDLVFSWG